MEKIFEKKELKPLIKETIREMIRDNNCLLYTSDAADE